MSTQETTKELPGGGVVSDSRTPEERAATRFYAVGTDSFMSGWGKAPGRSLYALPCTSYEEAEVCAENLRRRGDMKRVRIVGADWRPHMRAGDHLSIADRASASRHYTPGGF
jgi:hypothetical protein